MNIKDEIRRRIKNAKGYYKVRKMMNQGNSHIIGTKVKGLFKEVKVITAKDKWEWK
jgi:hypothetical protein